MSDFEQELAYGLTNDTLFKIFFDRNPTLFAELLAILLQRDIASFVAEFEVINAEVAPQFPGGKSTRRDMLGRLRVSAELIDAEVQNKATRGLANRVLFYWAGLYSRSLSKGEDYTALPKVTVVVILGETVFAGSGYVTRLTLADQDRLAGLVRQGDLQGAAELLAAEPSDRLELLFFDLTKVPADLAARASEYRDRPDWAILVVLAVFKARTYAELRAIEELGVPAVTMTIEAIREALADGPTRELIHQVEQARAEEKLDRIGYFEEGLAKGRVETLLRLIARRYGKAALTAEVESTVRAGTDRQVSDWTDRFADAQIPATAAEFLAGPSGPGDDGD